MSFMITCPICGRRNGYEFRYGGEDKGPYPWGQEVSPRQWTEYVHMNACRAGVQKEWWYHRDGCGSWFTIFRDTVANVEVENPEART
jgi:sarcosine oxidase subunit delta